MKRILTIVSMMAWFMGNIQSQPFLVGDTLDATSTYVNIQDTSLPFIPKGSSYYDIDIDFDNLADIRFQRFHMSSPMFQEMGELAYPLSNIQFAVVADSSADFDTLSAGNVVQEHPNWHYRSEGIYFNFYHDESPPPPWGHDYSHGICKKPNTYVGFRKINPSDTLYGWFLVDLPDPFTVRSFAVDRIFSSGAEDPEQEINELKVFPNPSTGIITIQSTQSSSGKALVIVSSVQEKNIFIQEINPSQNVVLDLSFLNNGNYFLRLQNDKRSETAKFIILRYH